MKRLISIFIAIILLISSVSIISVLAKDVSYDVSVFNGRLTSLKNLGVISDEFEGFSCDDFVTGGMFKKSLYNIFKVNFVKNSYGLNEVTEKRFISTDAALKIIIDILGYNPDGKYTKWYSNARNIGLTEFLSKTDGNLTFYDFVILNFNILKAEPNNEVKSIVNDTVHYKKASDTVSKIYMNAQYFDGIVIADNYGQLSYTQETGKDIVKIRLFDDLMLSLKSNGINTYGLLGYRTEGFYKSNGGNELVSIYPYENEVLNLNYKNYPYIENGYVYYEFNNKEKREKITADIELIHNGMNINTNEFKSLFDGKDGNVFYDLTFINNGIGNKYSVISIRTYKPYVIEAFSSKGFQGKTKNGDVIGYKDKYERGFVFVENIDGTMLLPEEIKDGDVLNIFENTNPDKAVMVFKTADRKEGYISQMGEKSKVVTYDLEIIGEENEFVDVEVLPAFEKNVGLGDYAEFVFDISGRLLRAEQKNSTSEMGIFVKLEDVDETKREDIRLLAFGDLKNEEKQELKLINISKGAKVFGNKITKDNIDSINKKLFHTIVNYSLNANGEIVKIYTSDAESDTTGFETINRHSELDSLDKLVDTDSCYCFSENNDIIFCKREKETDVPFNSEGVNRYSKDVMKICTSNKVLYTKLISVPDISINEASLDYKNEYGILDIQNIQYFNSGGKNIHKAEGYFKKGDIAPEYIVYFRNWYTPVESFEEIKNNDYPFLVNKVSTAINPVTGNNATKISGIYNNKYVDFYTADEKLLHWNVAASKYLDVSEGDIVILMFDALGSVTYGARLYDYFPESNTGKIDGMYVNNDNKVFKNATYYTDLITAAIVYDGYIYHILNDSTILYAINDNNLTFEDAYKSKIGFNKPRSIYVFDTEKNDAEGRAYTGDIKKSTVSYVQNSENASKIVIYHYSGNCKLMVIYK